MSDAASPSPGSNAACNSTHPEDGRIRREWSRMDEYDRALYLDAVETAIERGLHQRFAEFHSDEVSDIQAHDTCAFWLWHRVFILAYENMLRSLLPRFACLTLPFWDIHGDYAKQESTSDPCNSYSTCSKIINDIGGFMESDDWDHGTFFGRLGNGFLYSESPVQNLVDDYGMMGMIRYDLWLEPIPDEVGILSAEGIEELFGKEDRMDFWRTLHRGVHDSVHDTLGGFMRTPASPIDPLFMPWHSTMELLDYVWGLCRSDGTASVDDANGDGGTCTYTPKAAEHFPNISLRDDEAWIKLGDAADVRDDALIGAYFDRAMRFDGLRTIRDLRDRFKYADVPADLVRALGNSTELCPNGLGDVAAHAEDSNEPRRPPTFSDEQLEAMGRTWIRQARDYYEEGGAASAPDGNVEYVRCLLSEMDRDTVERWAIDEGTFMTQVVENRRYARHPPCRGHLSAGVPEAHSGADSGTNASSDMPDGGASNRSVDAPTANSGHCQAHGGYSGSLPLTIVLCLFSFRILRN